MFYWKLVFVLLIYILHTCVYVSYIIQWLEFAGPNKIVLREIDCIKVVNVAQ